VHLLILIDTLLMGLLYVGFIQANKYQPAKKFSENCLFCTVKIVEAKGQPIQAISNV